MNNIWEFLLLVFGVFIGTLLLGALVIEALPLGHTEAALLYLACVIAASAAWVGRKKQ